jgi:two-component system, NarL family, nitrate/nitrite response regulator NarL
MTASPIRICVIEDHTIVRAGLKILIEGQSDMVVTGEATDRATSFDVVAAQRPDILVVDLQLRNESAADFLKELLAINGARAIVLTGSTEQNLLNRVMREGASGLVYKDEAPDVLIRAIRVVYKGEAWFTRAMMTSALSHLRRDRPSQPKEDAETARIATLTPREREIIFLIANGLSRQNIAEKIFLSNGTVRNHLSSIFSKLEVSNQLALVFFAQRHGLDRLGDTAGT